jgi:hypothetical protein
MSGSMDVELVEDDGVLLPPNAFAAKPAPNIA